MGILKFFWYSPSSGLIPHGSLCVDRHSGFYFDPMMTCDNMFSWGQGLGFQTLARLPNTGSCKFSCQFRRSSVARSWGSWLVYQTQGHSSSCVSSEDPVILFSLSPASLTQKYLQRCKMINVMRPVGHKGPFEGPCQYLQSFRCGSFL